MRTRGYSSLSDCQCFPRVRNKTNKYPKEIIVSFLRCAVCYCGGVRACVFYQIETRRHQITSKPLAHSFGHTTQPTANTDDQHCQRISIFVFHLFTSGRRGIFHAGISKQCTYSIDATEFFKSCVCLIHYYTTINYKEKRKKSSRNLKKPQSSEHQNMQTFRSNCRFLFIAPIHH